VFTGENIMIGGGIYDLDSYLYNGFVGHVDNCFVYAESLRVDELDFLRLMNPNNYINKQTIGSGGMALNLSSEHFGVLIPSSSMTGGSFDSYMALTLTMWSQIKSELLESNADQLRQEYVLIEKGDNIRGFEYRV
jgi:hypothetical protein